MPHVELGEVRLAYDVVGEGPPVLMIMGFMARGRAWSPQVDRLHHDHTLCTFDNRGIGASTSPPGPWTTAQLAEDALRLLDHLGWDQAHVAGISMGGMIAQELALARPDRVRSLSLLATHHGGGARFLPTLSGTLRFLSMVTARTPDARVEAMMRVLYPDGWRETADLEPVRRRLADDMLEDTPDPRVARDQLAAVMRHDTRRRLGALEGMPVQVIKPAQDMLIKPVNSELVARAIPGAVLHEVPDAGHAFIDQHADHIADLLRRHVAAAESGTAPVAAR